MKHSTKRTLTVKDRYESVLTSQYGPRPINVFATLRTNQGLSHATLAVMMHTTSQALIRLEQGCFTEPLPVALEYWTNRVNLGLSELRLRDDYLGYQEQMRKRHHQYFGPLNDLDLASEHPIKQLKERHPIQPSTTEVAKALCLNQSTLQHWEKKWRTQQTVPSKFQESLLAIGYSRPEVVEFNNDYRFWRDKKLGRISVTENSKVLAL